MNILQNQEIRLNFTDKLPSINIDELLSAEALSWTVVFPVACIIFWICMLVSCVSNVHPRRDDRLIWVIILVTTNILGAVLYFFLQRPKVLSFSALQNKGTPPPDTANSPRPPPPSSDARDWEGLEEKASAPPHENFVSPVPTSAVSSTSASFPSFMSSTNSSTTASAAAIDPALVPQRTLASGAKMPAIGMGTFGSDHVSAQEVAAAVLAAAEVGYRHFDCAAVYGNEHEIGPIFKTITAPGSGVRREDLWITSKLWNDKHAEADVIPSAEKSLRDLGLDYLDLYLVHWPFPNFHPPGCDVSSRSAAAKPYIHENFMRTWRQLEKLQRAGKVRHIGVSNVTVPKLKLILRDAEIKPAVNEMELHPHFQQPELFEFVRANGIVPVGYCPLGSPGRPDRDRTPEDTDPLTDPVITRIAIAHKTHPAAICLKWAVQRGQAPIPFSSKRRNILANLQAVSSDPLTEDEMAKIAKIDRRCRFIKGQVFLWGNHNDWRVLWDESGVISQ
ncbi:MAG: aldo/keto reductase [Puniceicoccales bacterium]|jgi:diketogulonate reductase-like aldo/keto reductase|nr:aldo/keto reductase [Puniceicoccales bacterium]